MIRLTIDESNLVMSTLNACVSQLNGLDGMEELMERLDRSRAVIRKAGSHDMKRLTDFNREQEEKKREAMEAAGHTNVGCDKCGTELQYRNPPTGIWNMQLTNADGSHWVYCPDQECIDCQKSVLMRP